MRGLNETRRDRDSRSGHPTAPGTIAGSHDPAKVEVHILGYGEVMEEFLAFRDIMRGINLQIRLRLSVPLVPLTATGAEGLEFLLQPDGTRTGHLFTPDSDSRDSASLLWPDGVAQGVRDSGHINGADGAARRLAGCLNRL
jgi:hypothetical protein